MLTVSKVSASHAAHYYAAGAENETVYSDWYGKGAIAMSLTGAVDHGDFESTLNGSAPSGEPLYQKLKANRVPGYDLTFSAPKSVSIAAIWFEKKDLVDAHRRAVKETLNEIEAAAQTRRMSSRSKTHYLKTGNLAIATFEHTTNRANDPQLHTHAIVLNATRYQDKWRAYYARTVFDSILKWGKRYRDKLAEFVQELGYKLRNAKDGFWELASVPPRVVELFSKRRRQILEKVGEEASAMAKKFAALSTRKEKSFIPVSQLKLHWERQVEAIHEHVKQTNDEPELERKRKP